MPIQTSSSATAGNLTKYEAKYVAGALAVRTFDQFATPIGKTFEPKGTTVSREWLAGAVPRPTTAVGNENTDFEPQTIRDVAQTMTLYWRADGLKAHALAFLKSSLFTEAALAKACGALAMETIDALARRAATESSLVLYGGSTLTTARSSLDLGTSGHRMSIDCFTNAQAHMEHWQKNADGLFVVMTPFQFADLLITASGIVTTTLQYQDKEKLYNYEMGELAGIRIVKSPYAKHFFAAGIANAAPVATTIATSTTANIAGARTIEVAANTNMAVNMWLAVGTAQTGAESDATLICEPVKITAISGTTISILGSGPGGGLKYDHAVSAAVSNADTAHCAVFGSAQSLDVAWDGYGRYGQLVPIFADGNAKQWKTASFAYFGGYAVLDPSGIMRVETSSALM